MHEPRKKLKYKISQSPSTKWCTYWSPWIHMIHRYGQCPTKKDTRSCGRNQIAWSNMCRRFLNKLKRMYGIHKLSRPRSFWIQLTPLESVLSWVAQMRLKKYIVSNTRRWEDCWRASRIYWEASIPRRYLFQLFVIFWWCMRTQKLILPRARTSTNVEATRSSSVDVMWGMPVVQQWTSFHRVSRHIKIAKSMIVSMSGAN